MSCENCGAPCQGTYCSTCATAIAQEERGTTADERARLEAIDREHGSATGGEEA